MTTKKADPVAVQEELPIGGTRRRPAIYENVKHDSKGAASVNTQVTPALQSARADGAAHNDGWANLLTGLGVRSSDKRLSTNFIADPRLTWSDLTYLYRSDGLAKRIINLPTNDIFRAWFKIEGDPEGLIEIELRKLDAKKHLKQAFRLSRLFGGSLAILGINDGQTYDKPVAEKKIKGINHIHVFDRWRMTVNTADLYLDPANDKYGMPERYLVTPLYGNPFYVHESRVLRFEGEPVTDIVRIGNQGWADSVLQSCWDRLRALGEAYGNLEHIVDEFIIGLMTINNLQEMIAGGKEAQVKKRLNMVDMTKSVMNTVLLDSNETYSRISATTTGLGEIMDKIIEAMSAVTGIPVCLLMGRSQAGLSNDEGSQVRFYYDTVSGYQEEELYPQLNRLIHYLNLATGDKLGDEWFIRFNPLWQPTEKQIVEQRKMQAETDVLYINSGVITPEETALSRFGGDFYSHDTALDETHKVLLNEGGIAEETAEGEDTTETIPGAAPAAPGPIGAPAATPKAKRSGEASAEAEERRAEELKQAQDEPAADREAWNKKQSKGSLFGKEPPPAETKGKK